MRALPAVVAQRERERVGEVFRDLARLLRANHNRNAAVVNRGPKWRPFRGAGQRLRPGATEGAVAVSFRVQFLDVSAAASVKTPALSHVGARGQLRRSMAGTSRDVPAILGARSHR